MSVWHEDIGLSTLYAHVATTTTATTSQAVSRGEYIADMDSTGSCASGAHLHFGVTDGYATSSAISHRIDPFGWWSTSTDSWSYDQGYLWTTDPPSYDLARTASTTISTDTVWRGNYLVDGSVTVNSGVTLTVEEGAVVKFKTTTSLINVYGTLQVSGTEDHPVYFTSYHDDTVGGDTNGNGTSTSPGLSNWRYIYANSGAVVNMSYAVVRYGGSYSGRQLYDNGGTFNISHATISDSYDGLYSQTGTVTVAYSDIQGQHYGVISLGGSTEITSSTIHGSILAGVRVQGIGSALTLRDNSFTGNNYAANVAYYTPTFVHSGNAASGNSYNGIVVDGNINDDTTFTVADDESEMPYVVENSIVINAGYTLTIEPGAVVKFMKTGSKITVNGQLIAQGTATSTIYFTSIKDDSVGGDTNGDGTSTTPSAGNWIGIEVGSNATGATVSNAVVRYEGNLSGSGFYVMGGSVNLTSVTIASSSSYGVRNTSGTTNISLSEIRNQSYGVYITGGTVTISSSTLKDHAQYSIYKSGTPSSTAQNNYWGSAAGPYHATLNPSGSTSSKVTNYVDFIPFATSSPF
jgi:hypothetical protein